MTMMAPHPHPLPLAQPPAAFGDTTLTKVFVGGLAWETHKDTLREHFERYGDILEAVIISDKLTGRSKGYGFVSAPLLLISLFYQFAHNPPMHLRMKSPAFFL